MRVSIHLDDQKFRRDLRRLNRRVPGGVATVAKMLAAVAKEYARDIITTQIYATPERGGYRRTRQLIRSIYSQAVQEGQAYKVVLGASASYAAYNEFGTYDGYFGEGAADKILEDARYMQALDRLITLEYGRVERGLEPRPFLLPAIVMTEAEAPALVSAAIRRLARG